MATILPLASAGADTLDEDVREQQSARDLLLTAPLPVPRLSFFHAALEVPPLEPAATLPPGAIYLGLETSHARSVERHRIDGVENHFDGLFHDWGALKLTAGVLPRLELGIRAALAGWDEELDVFTLLDRSGNPIVENEDKVFFGTGASKRHDNLSDVVLRAKGRIFSREEVGFDLALASSVKIPVARPNDLTNAGTTDWNVTLLGSVPVGRLTLHANLGSGIPFGEQNLFINEAHVDLNPFLHGGLGVNWQVAEAWALILQLEGNTSAFRDVDFLDGGPLTVLAGFRALLGNFLVEGGGGTGLIQRSSYDFAFHFGVGYLF